MIIFFCCVIKIISSHILIQFSVLFSVWTSALLSMCFYYFVILLFWYTLFIYQYCEAVFSCVLFSLTSLPVSLISEISLSLLIYSWSIVMSHLKLLRIMEKFEGIKIDRMILKTTNLLVYVFSLIMAVDGIAKTSGFAENIGLRPNIPGRNFTKNYFFVADNVVHIYKSCLLYTSRCV